MTEQSKVAPVEAQAVPDLPVASFDEWWPTDPVARAHADSSRDLALIEHGWHARPPPAAADLHQQFSSGFDPVVWTPADEKRLDDAIAARADRRAVARLRQWFDAVQDLNPHYLEAADHALMARIEAAQLVAASPAAAADLELFNEACAILAAVMSYELPTELKLRIVNVLCTDASPVAPAGAPTEERSANLADLDAVIERWQGLHDTVESFSDDPDKDRSEFAVTLKHLRAFRALLSRPGCELATAATKQPQPHTPKVPQ